VVSRREAKPNRALDVHHLASLDERLTAVGIGFAGSREIADGRDHSSAMIRFSARQTQADGFQETICGQQFLAGVVTKLRRMRG